MTDMNASRRDFLKGAATAAASVAAANAFVSRSAFAASDETIKIALIGCGGRGTAACSQALSTKGPVKLIAVADAFEDNAQGALDRLRKEHAEHSSERVDVKPDHVFVGFDAYKKAIDCGIDLILIATPPGFRPIHFEYAVKQGKNVFMEKPLATDPAGIRKVLAAAQEAKSKNLTVAVGLQRHHQAIYLETVKRIHDGELGDLRLLRVYWNGDSPWVRGREQLAERKKAKGGGALTEMEYQMRNWYYFVWLCGDHINEQHIHNLDVANWVLKGHPVEAQGVGGRQVRTGIDNGEIYDHHMIEYTYADGTKVLSECRHQGNTWNSVSEHAHGTKAYCNIGEGTIMSPDGKQTIWKYPRSPRNRGGEPDPYQVEHDDLFAALRNNNTYSEAEYGAHSTMTALLGRMCTYSGQTIKWDDAMGAKVSYMPQTFAWDGPTPTQPDKDGRYPIPMPGKRGEKEIWERANAEIIAWANPNRRRQGTT